MYGAPKAGATYSGTVIGISDFYAGTAFGDTQVYITAWRDDGQQAQHMDEWKVYIAVRMYLHVTCCLRLIF